MPHFTRDELYLLVWSKPLSRLAPELGVSDVGLGKACDRLKIPRPPQGYWTKQRLGKAGPPPPMPDIAGPQEWGLPARPARRSIKLPSAPVMPVFPEATDRHELIARTERGLRPRSPDCRGLVSPRGKRLLNVEVSEDMIDRSLRILDSLTKALEDRGRQVTPGEVARPRSA